MCHRTDCSEVREVELAKEYEWVDSTDSTAVTHFAGKAVVGGHEGWDGNELWVIRSCHNGDLIPGKLSVRHNRASVVYGGKETHVHKIEVLIAAQHESLKWVPACNGEVPPGAISGGRTVCGETLYVGRVQCKLSFTLGKVHPSHGCCYVASDGKEVAHKNYEILCQY